MKLDHVIGIRDERYTNILHNRIHYHIILRSNFKADMKSLIPLETAAAIFFLVNLFLKQGIRSEYVMVDFICMGLLDLLGARTEIYKMKWYYPQWDLNPGYFTSEATSLSVALLVEISTENLNVDRVLPECDIKLYLYRVPRVRCSKMFCCVLHFINSLQSATVLKSQTAKQYKYYMTNIRNKSPRVQVDFNISLR